MTDATLSLHMDDTGMWRVHGNYLGYDLATASTSLWDCLEQCKQKVWDAEMAHDVSAGLLTAVLLESEHARSDRAFERRALAPVEADVQGERDAHRLDAGPDGQPSADVLRQARYAVMLSQQARVAFVQRHLRIVYALAVSVLEALVAEQTVSEVLEDGRRRVLRSFPGAAA